MKYDLFTAVNQVYECKDKIRMIMYVSLVLYFSSCSLVFLHH